MTWHRAEPCPVCPMKHVLGLASCPSPPAASCPPNTGLPVIFHPGCELCPNEMFSYVPLIGLGPIQVSLFIQTLSSSCFAVQAAHHFCRTATPPSPVPPSAHSPSASGQWDDFVLKPGKKKRKKKDQQAAKKNSHGSAALGPGTRQPWGLRPQPFPKLPLHRHLCLELKVWVHQLHWLAEYVRVKLISRGKYLALER